MDTSLQDIRYGVRVLLEAPAFVAVAVLTLALGIGANTALFSIASGVLSKPLPFREPEPLVALYTRSKEFARSSLSYPNFLAIGLSAALVLARLIANLVYGVKPHDPLIFAGVAALPTLVSLGASYLPALRATQVDPVMAVRYE
jgi:hypothetical protein